MPEGFPPPVIRCKGRRDEPYVTKEQPLQSSCNPPGMAVASLKERNWLKLQLLYSSRIRWASGERLLGCNDTRGLYGNAHQSSAAAAVQAGNAAPRVRGSVIDALASGREADNGCGMLAVLCHQTRGLKDGAVEYYQSFLDQDVMLSGSFSFSLSPPPLWWMLFFPYSLTFLLRHSGCSDLFPF